MDAHEEEGRADNEAEEDGLDEAGNQSQRHEAAVAEQRAITGEGAEQAAAVAFFRRQRLW